MSIPFVNVATTTAGISCRIEAGRLCELWLCSSQPMLLQGLPTS